MSKLTENYTILKNHKYYNVGVDSNCYRFRITVPIVKTHSQCSTHHKLLALLDHNGGKHIPFAFLAHIMCSTPYHELCLPEAQAKRHISDNSL